MAYFDSGPNGADGLFAVSLNSGEKIILRTDPSPNTLENVDTVLTLIDNRTSEQLAQNDDFGSTKFSRLEFTAHSATDLLIRVAAFGDHGFDPDTEFQISFDYAEVLQQDIAVLSDRSQTLSFEATETTGEAFYRVRLSANERITVETAALPPSYADIDTVVYLLDATTRAVLASNDDGFGTRFSRLQHSAWNNREMLIQIVAFGDQPFQPGIGFIVTVDVETVPSPPVLSDFPARLAFEATEANPEGLYRVYVDPNQQITVETSARPDRPQVLDTVVYLLDATTGEGLAWNDDGAGLGLFSRVAYTASAPTQVIVRITEIGDRPFEPGTEFTVDVDVSPSDQPAANSRQSP